MKSTFPWMVLLVGLALVAWDTPSFSEAEPPDLLVAPYDLHITGSFQGASVTVSAEMAKNTKAVVEVIGPVRDYHLLRQGRRGGLWMSVGEVTVHGAPNLYLVLSTPGVPSSESGHAQWGYDALRKEIKFGGSVPKSSAGDLFDQFIELKESQRLYGIFPNSLKFLGTSGDRSRVEGQFRLPDNIAPGTYQVVLSVLNSGKVVQQTSTDLSIEMRGLPKFLTSLAWNHAALYGLMAVFVALAAGFVMGFLFKGKAAH